VSGHTPGPWELESVRMDCAGIIRQWPCRQAWLAGMWVTGPDGVRTLASWNGREWVFAQPVLGRHYTSEAPIAWGEL